jgi:hypothetical protein
LPEIIKKLAEVPMNTRFSFLSLLLLVVLTTGTSFAAEPAETLARKAVSENVVESSAAIEELRDMGPAGLQTLMAKYADEINRHINNPNLKADAEWQRISKALDTVAGQKNSYLSGLYWYTDLKDARKVSAETGKPILSLRLLGKLTDELSCANSRFFRTVLYSNADIAAMLRDRFVLHWQSVRPVPVVTIDFGDGRKLERTITGNSIHYVLDSAGQPIEAFPGLYGPQAFVRGLIEAETLFKSLGDEKNLNRYFFLRNFYVTHSNKISAAWLNDTMKIGGKIPQGVAVVKSPDGTITAVSIAPLAATKMYSEANVLRAISTFSETMNRMTDEAAWRRIAKLHEADAALDLRSIALIKRQNPSLSEKQLAAMLEKLQQSIALDTVRNEYMLHGKLYEWLVTDPSRTDLDKFNERVYAELFLTPRSDPWLGLVSSDVYMALDNGGIVNK